MASTGARPCSRRPPQAVPNPCPGANTLSPKPGGAPRTRLSRARTPRHTRARASNQHGEARREQSSIVWSMAVLQSQRVLLKLSHAQRASASNQHGEARRAQSLAQVPHVACSRCQCCTLAHAPIAACSRCQCCMMRCMHGAPLHARSSQRFCTCGGQAPPSCCDPKEAATNLRLHQMTRPP